MFAFIMPNTDSHISVWMILAVSIFKAALIVSGSVCVYLGYRLFRLGIVGESDVEAGADTYKLTIKRAAPGSVFALFGAILVGITAYKGLDIEYGKESGTGQRETLKTQAVVLSFPVWEFKVEPIDESANLQESLNKIGGEFGKQGWDLIEIFEHGPAGKRQFLCVLKRLKPSQTSFSN